MKTTPILFVLLGAGQLAAQQFLFTTTQTEQTLSGSAGTVLRWIHPNEIALAQVCGASAEKWAPRACFQAMAGDEDGDAVYWEPALMGAIDALLAVPTATAVGITNQRTIFYSVSAPLGPAVSGAPGLRPGDVGRIRRIGALDGQVEYFLRAEQVQLALGLPPLPATVNVDAIAASPNYGILFSLEDDVAANLCASGPTFVRDGDVLLIPPAAIAWNPNGTVAGVAAGSAVVAISEAQMDLLTVNATVADRNGVCVGAIVDTDALEFDDGATAPFGFVPTCFGVVPVPHLLFAGEALTGGAILDTEAGGRIHPTPCGLLGTMCGFGPTTGAQIGLRPPSAVQGIASSVNALCNARVGRFVSESPAPQTPVGTPAVVQFASPGPTTWVFVTFAPVGPAVVPPSAPFVWGLMCFPDYFPVPNFLAAIPTGGGFGSYSSPPVPWPADLLFQGITITPAGLIEASTPTIVEVL